MYLYRYARYMYVMYNKCFQKRNLVDENIGLDGVLGGQKIDDLHSALIKEI